MSMEFEKVTLIWSQRYVGHLLANPKEEFCDIIDGFLAVYLEVAPFMRNDCPRHDISTFTLIFLLGFYFLDSFGCSF